MMAYSIAVIRQQSLSLVGFLKRAGRACHPERSEGSLVGGAQILRYAQDDSFSPLWLLS
jgi:hypothetical protein